MDIIDDLIIPLPTCGRIVNYLNFVGEIRAAIVMNTPPTKVGQGAYLVDLTVFELNGPIVRVCVGYADSDAILPGTWHWMPYQLGQAKFGAKPGF